MKCLVTPVPAETKTTTDIVNELSGLTREARELAFEELLLAGHVPQWLKTYVPVKVEPPPASGAQEIIIDVLPDYLRLGTDSESFLVPLWPLTAQRVADAWGCLLPTTRLVTLLWQNADYRIPPQPWGPPYDSSMMSTSRIVAHNLRVEATMKRLGAMQGRLIAGHKKDVVISNRLLSESGKVAIFGWHMASGKNIQPLYLGHYDTYSDYSHGIRLIHSECTVDGEAASLEDLLRDPNFCGALSDEGPMHLVRQPNAHRKE